MGIWQYKNKRDATSTGIHNHTSFLQGNGGFFAGFERKTFDLCQQGKAPFYGPREVSRNPPLIIVFYNT